jgi:hypothetical protein
MDQQLSEAVNVLQDHDESLSLESLPDVRGWVRVGAEIDLPESVS